MRELLFSATRKDFRVETFRAGGPGGQHQNKTESGVRITHIATGLTAISREGKSQHQNKKLAFQRLAQRLHRHVLEQVHTTPARVNTVIRTYNEAQDRVSDYASQKQFSYRRIVGKRDLAPVIEARALAMRELP